MSFSLGVISKEHLVGVHPRLVAVVERAIQITAQDFTVVEGVRSAQQMCINYGKGRSPEECQAKGVPASYARPDLAKVTWLNHPLQSKHGVHNDGFGHAVDLAPWVGTAIDWDTRSRFEVVAQAMHAAAVELNTMIIWGGSWHGTPDLPHHELVG